VPGRLYLHAEECSHADVRPQQTADWLPSQQDRALSAINGPMPYLHSNLIIDRGHGIRRDAVHIYPTLVVYGPDFLTKRFAQSSL
jgi:hypothetical protein